jgi:phosphate transport system protein
MMRRQFDSQLDAMHTKMIQMGALCEDAIASASKALLDGDEELREKAISLERDIDMMERDIETLCYRLLLHQQPIAGDLRQVTAAQHMIVDMERVGDQAADIAELCCFMKGSPVKSDVHIADMARAAIKMLTDSIDSYVNGDLALVKTVLVYDDVVDDLFSKVKGELIEQILQDSRLAGDCLDLLMIAKYFERIGDHAQNIAEWVLYSITGSRNWGEGEGTQ